MNIKSLFKLKIIVTSIILFILLFSGCIRGDFPNGKIESFPEPPIIYPDYANVIVPPNIAPLNFLIKEKAKSFYVEIYSVKGSKIKIAAKNNKIQIPLRKWRKLLSANTGKELYFDIYSKNSNGYWEKYKTITNKIAQENIDSYVAYRLINAGYVFWNDLGIYQRNIENFNETPILTNRALKRNCMNCHSFCKNNPDFMMLHLRQDYPGTLIVRNGVVEKINTKTKYTMSSGVYPAWHPDGAHIAFSVNIIRQNFHGDTGESIYVFDKFSDLIVYNIETNTITTSPKVSTDRLENLPNWSPDGKYLYFCSAPKIKNLEFNEIKYDLMRISYDVKKDIWGNLDTILTSKETGKSISYPKVSPDGKFLLFCMSDYGYFNIHLKSTDLYMMDLQKKTYWSLDSVNSKHSDSYHSWSVNSHWFVFASRRLDGLYSRLFFSYVDDNGKAYKPVLLPQDDPEFYDSFLKNYNLPEMITGPVKVNPRDLIRAAYSEPINAKFDNNVDVDALSGATKIVK